nr:gluconokinase [Domibacillus epiphyticus]
MLGVDLGTTSTKSVLFATDGKVIAHHTIEYPLLTPTPSTAEQNPDEIYTAVLGTIKETIRKSAVAPQDLLCISFSSAMHSVIAVDESGKPLTNCMTWADNRSAAWAKKMKNELNSREMYFRTGTPIHPMSPLSKIRWIKEEMPDTFSKTKKFISIKEYVFLRLFNQFIVDHSIASATGMLHLHNLDWDEEALQAAGITPDHLSTLVPTTHYIQGLHWETAVFLGILPSVPFVVGANDGVLSNLGVSAIEPGVVAVTIGTSGAIRTVTDKPVTDPKGRTFCYALTENHWVIGGPVNNGGMTFRWVRDVIASAEVETAKSLGIHSYEMLTKIAERVSPGADGLLFHPYLAGERAPLWNPDARGSFFGLTLHHKKEHMIRAVLEGVIFNLYNVFLALKEQIGVPQKVLATGGFARSALWRQMMADIFDQEVSVPESFESSCLGAAVLGLYALKEIDSLNVVSKMVGATFTHAPIQENVDIYRELVPIYLRVSRKLSEEYTAIAEFQRKTLE